MLSIEEYENRIAECNKIISDAKNKINDIENKISKLKKKLDREVAIVFWRKYTEILNIPFDIKNIGDEEFRCDAYYKIITDKKYYIKSHVNSSDNYFSEFYIPTSGGNNDYIVSIRRREKHLHFKFSNKPIEPGLQNLVNTMKSSITHDKLEKLAIYISKYKQMLKSTPYLTHIDSALTFYSLNLFPKPISKLIFQKCLQK
jgi:hypothetical protein